MADDTRIRASLPTLRYLLDEGAAGVAVCSHLGRPKGPDPAFAIAPVAARLAELLPDERLRVLENTRFDPGETKNDPGVGEDVSPKAWTCTSTTRSARPIERMPRRWAWRSCCPPTRGSSSSRSSRCSAGSSAEVERPFVLVAGGAKVADKLGVLEHLGGRADSRARRREDGGGAA